MSLVQKLLDGPLDIIGDIHGEYDALVTLVKNLGYDTDGNHKDGRKIILVGDFVDRGPNSPAVIHFVKNLIDNNNAQAVLGNHELNLLQNKPKDGAGWYFAERYDQDINYQPFQTVKENEYNIIVDFLSGLPIALEREDLRIVHATWKNEDINVIKNIPLGTVKEYYINCEKQIDDSITSSGLLKAYNDEQDVWKDEQTNPNTINMPFLENTCKYNIIHQMNNPIRVLTSGVEKKTKHPFYASGKWRFVERFPWWNEYTDNTPVIVGHFWRRFSGTSNDPENLFNNIEPNTWHGAKSNVFCVDFSVGGRFLERLNDKTIGEDTQLVALRWPERTLMLEDGEILVTNNFESE